VELRPIDLAVLRHVGLYRLTMPLVVERVFSKRYGGNAGTTLGQLARAGLLRDHKTVAEGAFTNGVRFFTITPEGVKVVSAAEDRGKPLGPPAQRLHLATLWFCCLSDHRRYRLEPAELNPIFGKKALHPNVAVCLAEEAEGPRMYRVYESTTSAGSTIKKVRQTIAKMWNTQVLRPWMNSGQLGIAVLAETTDKCERLEAAIRRVAKGKPSIADECNVIVRFAPSPVTVSDALMELNKAASKKAVK